MHCCPHPERDDAIVNVHAYVRQHNPRGVLKLKSKQKELHSASIIIYNFYIMSSSNLSTGHSLGDIAIFGAKQITSSYISHHRQFVMSVAVQSSLYARKKKPSLSSTGDGLIHDWDRQSNNKLNSNCWI